MSVPRGRWPLKARQHMAVTSRREGGGPRLGPEGWRENRLYLKVRTCLCPHYCPLQPITFTELGINFPHISAKSMTVLNPLRRVDEHIMDDADLAGPLLFIICFGTFLLFVSSLMAHPFQRSVVLTIPLQSGKPQFGYIYGVGLLGSASIYTLLNLMSENGIDAYRVASVLGYCLLPMVGVGAISVMVTLEYVHPQYKCIAVILTEPLQWHDWICFIDNVRTLVHVVSVYHFRCSSADVRAAVTSRVSDWIAVRLFRATQCIQRR